jgi:transcriptional regulator with XRE-family HTH domain
VSSRKPSFRARQLGRALRALREGARLTQAQAGKLLRYDGQKISRIEKGQVPDIHALEAMLDRYGLTVNEWQPYLAMWDRANEKGWWRAFGMDDTGFVSVEHDAQVIRSFEAQFIPGLLQTEPYMRAVFGMSRVRRAKRWIDNEVAVRLRRQRRLVGEPPLELRVVIDEFALRRRFSPDVMREQLMRIVEPAALPNVTFQVVPESVGPYPGMRGSFSVLSFPDHEEHDLGYVEHAYGVAYLEKAERVRECRLAFDHLSRLALSPDESIALIERRAAEL